MKTWEEDKTWSNGLSYASGHALCEPDNGDCGVNGEERKGEVDLCHQVGLASYETECEKSDDEEQNSDAGSDCSVADVP